MSIMRAVKDTSLTITTYGEKKAPSHVTRDTTGIHPHPKCHRPSYHILSYKRVRDSLTMQIFASHLLFASSSSLWQCLPWPKAHKVSSSKSYLGNNSGWCRFMDSSVSQVNSSAPCLLHHTFTNGIVLFRNCFSFRSTICMGLSSYEIFGRISPPA